MDSSQTTVVSTRVSDSTLAGLDMLQKASGLNSRSDVLVAIISKAIGNQQEIAKLIKAKAVCDSAMIFARDADHLLAQANEALKEYAKLLGSLDPDTAQEVMSRPPLWHAEALEKAEKTKALVAKIRDLEKRK